jgi:hypothetical protein
MMSQVWVAWAFLSMSTEITSKPRRSNARPMEPVPQKSSSSLIF